MLMAVASPRILLMLINLYHALQRMSIACERDAQGQCVLLAEGLSNTYHSPKQPGPVEFIIRKFCCGPPS